MPSRRNFSPTPQPTLAGCKWRSQNVQDKKTDVRSVMATPTAHLHGCQTYRQRHTSVLFLFMIRQWSLHRSSKFCEQKNFCAVGLPSCREQHSTYPRRLIQNVQG